MARGGAAPQPVPPKAAALPQKRGRPALSALILHAVSLSANRRGASLAFIKKTLAGEGYDVGRNGGRLKAALGALLDKGLLQRVTGSGLAGSFRIGRGGKERAQGAGRRGRAAGGARRRRAGKAKGPRRRAKATAARLKKPRRPRGKAAEEEAAGGAAEAGGAAAAEGEC